MCGDRGDWSRPVHLSGDRLEHPRDAPGRHATVGRDPEDVRYEPANLVRDWSADLSALPHARIVGIDSALCAPPPTQSWHAPGDLHGCGDGVHLCRDGRDL